MRNRISIDKSCLKKWENKYNGSEIQIISDWEKTRNYVLMLSKVIDNE